VTVRIRVLGSAAGGGFPQWNCGCPNCKGAREGTVTARPRTQESVAVTADEERWFLLNASPEIRSQIEGFPPLHPRGPRHSPIAAILLTNGDLDHCLGLLSLRESHPLVVYATESVRRGVTEGNVFYRTLERFPDQVTWRALKPGSEEVLADRDGRPSDLTVVTSAMPGKRPLHLEEVSAPDVGDNVGFRIRDARSRRVFAYCSSVGAITDEVRRAVAGAQCLFFDGTFWSNDELPALGFGARSAEQMAHWPVGGPAGTLAALAGLDVPRRILIHLNNTNPILREDSAERAVVEAAGWEVAHDGLEVTL
jgi:pyrroloquinoline quinone biosynthesis protein B